MLFFRLLVLFLAVSALAVGADAPSETGRSGTYRGRILTERFYHQQAISRRIVALAAEQAAPARPDQGDIAVLDTSNGVVPEANAFDLRGLTIRFTPSQAGYASAPGPLALDEAARVNGSSLALQDDDATRVDIPFAFPFFGAEYRSLWVNSDGNMTFGEGDGRVAARSIARAISGPPRVAPLFLDLDPSRPAARVRVESRTDRLFVTWDGVPQFTASGTGRRQIFQAELAANGSMAFHYLTANVPGAVVGVFEGRLASEPAPADFSLGPSGPAPGGLAEIFQLLPQLDLHAAGQQFYRGHGDAYDFLVVFNDFGLAAAPGAFAFEVNVRNDILGIGDLLSDEPVFDFGQDFGSPKRLVSFLNMGPLSNYPDDPAAVIPSIGENSTLSVMGQEAGHRWGAYVEFINPATGLPSASLLGRQDAHWNFFFNSQASVLEGNEIVDRGEAASPRFETVDAVSRFSELDQYIMGLRSPEEVSPSFLVLNPRNAGSTSPARQPQTGVRFDGDRQNVGIEMIVAAEGRRSPDHTVAAREFRFAFVLLVDRDAQPRPEDVAKLDRIRREWETFFNQAVAQRAVAQTEIVRSLELSVAPAAGVLQGAEGAVRIEIDEPLNEDLLISLTAEGNSIGVPLQVTIPAGERSAVFPVRGLREGVGVLRATAGIAGFDAPVAHIQALADPGALVIEADRGAGQDGVPGQPLPEPVVFSVRDHNRLRYLGVELVLTASANGSAEPARIVTGPDGLVSTTWRLPTATGAASLRAASLRAVIAGRQAPALEIFAGDVGLRPSFSASLVVNAASFNQGSASLLRGVSPGGLTTIFGAGFSSGTEAAREFPLPRKLAGSVVRVNGLPAPLLLVSPGQINLQIPFELVGSEAQIVVESPVGASDSVLVEVAPYQPGIFTDAVSGLAAIIYASDGLSPWHRPVRPGEHIQIFSTGLGAVSPRVETGEAAPPLALARTLAAPRVLIGGRSLTPSFSGLAPFFAGLYQVNVQIPADLEPGSHDVVLETGTGSSNAGALHVAAP